jgi:hypothetical protein
MNKNQRHRRMKAKRRECRLLYGVNRVQQLPRPRSGMGIQLILEMAYQRARRAARPMVDEYFSNNFGTVRSVWETPSGNS